MKLVWERARRLTVSSLTVLRERGVKGFLVAVMRRVRSEGAVLRLDHIYIDDISRDLDGVDVVGFFTAEHGVGEAARNLVSGLRICGVRVSTIDYKDTESRKQHYFPTEDESRHHTLFVSLNAEQLCVARHRFGDRFFADRYVIGQWFWELEEAPAWYQQAWPLVDELWAPTRFIETMLRKYAPADVAIRHVPLPIEMPKIDETLTRDRWNLDDRFMFFFAFDLMSVMKRKNPLGLIAAYRQAFKETDGVQLVIKTMNGDKRQQDFEALVLSVGGRSDITVINEVFASTENATLMSKADCYVSLHRSEGLGLTMGEAMSLGLPVIATNYSGNTDFMDDKNSFLVPWKRVPVGDEAGGYSSTATWAEPDEETAIAAMRYVYENRDDAHTRGRRAQMDVLTRFSTASTGAKMKSRLEEIWRTQRGQ